MYVANLIKLVLKSINSGDIILFHKSNPLKRNFSLQEKKINKKKKGIKSIFSNKNEKKEEKESSKFSLIINKSFKMKGNKSKNKVPTTDSDIKIINFKRKKKVQSNFINSSSNQIKNYNYNEEELNKLEYEEALIIDKRGYLQYYWSLLKKNNLVIFTFFQKTDYNLPMIKYSLFLISLSLELPKIIYSSFISILCNLIINSLALSEKSLLKLKKIKDKYKRDNSSAYLYVFLRRKITIYILSLDL